MDTEIVERAKAGDTDALENIYNETRQMVYFTALGILHNKDDAEDVVQDTYIKVFQNISRLNEEKAFINWLKIIVVNVCKNNLKKHKPALFLDHHEEDSALESIEEVSEDFLPQEYIDQAEKREIIKNMVENLPDSQRIAVILYYFNELPLAEVSKVMGTTEGTTKSRLNYARKQIRAKVEEQEKQGNKLYAGVPMLTRILKLVARQYNLPDKIASRILANSFRASHFAGSTAASSNALKTEAMRQAEIADRASEALTDSVSGTGEEGALAGTAKTAAAKGLVAKIAGMSAKTRMIVFILVGAVAVAVGTGVTAAVKQRDAAAREAVVIQQKQKAASAAKAKAASEAAAKAASEAAEKEKAAAEAEARKKAAETAAKKKAEEASQEKDKAVYQEFYDANFKGKAKGVFFYDIDHDRSNDMIVSYEEGNDGEEIAYLEIYSVKNDQIEEIYSASYGMASRTSVKEFYVYQEGGWDYILFHGIKHLSEGDEELVQYGDIGDDVTEVDEEVCDICSLKDRCIDELRSDGYGRITYRDGRVKYEEEGMDKQKEEKIQKSIQGYLPKSELIFKDDFDGGITFCPGNSDFIKAENTDSSVGSAN